MTWIDEELERFKKNIHDEAQRLFYTADKGSLLDRIWSHGEIRKTISDLREKEVIQLQNLNVTRQAIKYQTERLNSQTK